MIAVVTVRDGMLATGAEEAIAEAGGVAVVAGGGASSAAAELAERARRAHAGSECHELRVLELGAAFRPAEWAGAIAPHVESANVVVLPASPDGRDLAPRLAAALGRPLLAGAIAITGEGASLAWMAGRQVAHVRSTGPFVATLLAGSRSALATLGVTGSGASGSDAAAIPVLTELEVPLAAGREATAAGSEPAGLDDPELVEVIAADPAVMDLAEAGRIVAAGAGVGGPEQLAMLELVAAKLGAPLGATRVVTDAGWLGHDRQIGTTGVSVRPRCYMAFGISGAAQHLGGLGTPSHVISVNLDRSCPMMVMADLALVTDAPALVGVLARRLSEVVTPPPSSAFDRAVVPIGAALGVETAGALAPEPEGPS